MRSAIKIIILATLTSFGALFAGNVFTGTWQGKLAISGQELRIVFHITQENDGSHRATMDSPDQGATGISVEQVLINEPQIELTVAVIGGVFKGVLKQDEQRIDGIWSQSGYRFPLNLRRAEMKAKGQTQISKADVPYGMKELTVINPVQGNTISGTLTFPNDNKTHPALILISGSGAQDRDETIFGHKLFWVIADYLTRRGFAVFRYDDRGVSGSDGDLAASTLKDLSTDVQALVTRLKKIKSIDGTKIGLLGHSEGGLVAALTASEDTSLAFLVLMAAPGIVGSEIICDQVGALSRMAGLGEERAQQNMKMQRKILDIVTEEKNRTVAAEKLKKILPPEKYPQIRILLSPKYRSLIASDPAPVLTKIKCPLLAINGSKDIQVGAKKNLSAISAALRKGGNKHFQTEEIPDVNHLFQTAKTGAVSEYGTIKETINRDVLRIIGGWLMERTGINAGR